MSGLHNIENSNEDVLMDILKKLWREEEAQDIAEYAVMLASFWCWWWGRFGSLLEFQQRILKCLEFSSVDCMCALFARSGVVHANSSAVRR